MKTEIIKIHPESPEISKITYCAKIIKEGGLVIFPTETVYGIAADFSNSKAIKKLYKVKKRSNEKPFSVLVSSVEAIANYTNMSNPVLYKLINAYWPGPLTVVVDSKKEGKTIGVRMPDNIIALRLLKESKCTLAAPSANLENNEPPSTVEEALKDLDGLVDVAIDGGPSKLRKGSTIVDLTKGKIEILREGAITKSDLQRVSEKKTVLFVCTGNSCRSVMADYLLKDIVKDREDVEIFSAGTSVFLQTTASNETIAVLKEKGIDAAAHFSRPIDTILLKQADLIFVMTKEHRRQVLEYVPDVSERVYLLKEFAAADSGLQANFDIPDPMGGSYQMYKESLQVIEDAIKKVAELI